MKSEIKQKTIKQIAKKFRTDFEKDLAALSPIPFNQPLLTPLFVFKTPDPSPTYPITFSHTFAFNSFSSYPILNGRKIGNPICDYYQSFFYDNAVIHCLCDGCGIGLAPRKAAETACSVAINSITSNIGSVSNISGIGNLMINAVMEAHNQIYTSTNSESKSALIGATTILLQVIIEIDKEKKKFGIITLNIGDCHSYLNANGKTSFLFDCNVRENLKDIRSSQGRIGQNPQQMPDLNNASLVYSECKEGDLLVVATDGIHDNFDPLVLCLDKIYGDNVNEKQKYIENMINQHIVHSSSLYEMVESIGQYVVNITAQSRDVQSNPSSPGIDNRVPGKVDHSTIAIVKVGHLDEFFFVDSLIPSYNHILNPVEVGPPPSLEHNKIRREHHKLFVVNTNYIKSRTSSTSDKNKLLSSLPTIKKNEAPSQSQTP